MAKKVAAKEPVTSSRQKPSALLDTRVVYCGDNLEQLAKLPDACVDLIYIDPPFNSNRNYEVFWGETKEKRAFEDRHENTKAYIDYMRPRCVQLARVLVTNFFDIVKLAELASQGFWPFDRTAIVIRSRIAAL